MSQDYSGRLPLVYILSTGRSGSTLLDLLLGSHSDLWTLGELDVLRHELYQKNRPCGCGKPMLECPFWKRVIPNLPLESPVNVDYFRETYSTGRVLRLHHLPDLFRQSVHHKRTPEADLYAETNAELLTTIKNAAEEYRGQKIQHLVDASKDVYRLFWLQRSPKFDLRILHLTKDPRGFVYSNLKDDPPNPLRKTIRMAGRWLVQNGLMRYVGRNAQGSYRLLRYEDLARQPRATLNEIQKWLGIGREPERQSDIRETENHAVSGNDMRWREDDIYLDDAWRHELSSSFQLLVWVMTGLFARRLGYRKAPYWT